ncbi:serine hydrolase [Niabella beijingensis]|uniref:serine hydrolase n=1 Tax=Niabella beijingensis TaxID=2872700 RepID=UPI001CC12B89|nr:serine hydrolase [Niabella beijingensis]MBZ4191468.1 serine hydrolase [Niabella beijingensis]
MKQLFFLLGMIGTLCGQAQRSESFVRDSLDRYVADAMQAWQIPGVAVAVVRNGKTVLMRIYGIRELGSPGKIGSNTLFMIGSNTKAFTATALALLQAEDKLKLGDPVIKYLPEFKLYDPWVTQHATIRDLLSHRLGFNTFQGDFMFFDSDLSSGQVREKLAKLKPAYDFRTTWGYCNAAFLTAGEIIPRVTGKSWAQYLRERIFDPLGMNHTVALSSDFPKQKNIAAAHTVYLGKLMKVPYGQIDNLAPAGSIGSSIADMTHWVELQLAEGAYQGKQVIPGGAIFETRMPHSIIGLGGHAFNRSQFGLYGLGWFTGSYEARRVVSHTGGVNGFLTSVYLLPEEQLGIIVLTNTESNNFYNDLTNELADAYLDLPFRNYSRRSITRLQQRRNKEIKEAEERQQQIASKPRLPVSLDAFTGQYEHSVYGKMNITREKDTLVMHFEHHPRLTGRLYPKQKDAFWCFYSIPMYGIEEIPFTIEGGNVKTITVRVAGFIEDAPYVFSKTRD